MATATPLVRTPPQSIEAERAVIGSMMQSVDALEGCLEMVDEDDFFREAHRNLFAAMRSLFTAHTPIDLVSLVEFLRRAGKLDLVGGVTALSDITVEVPTPGNYEHYATIVREKAQLRRLISQATRLVDRAYSEESHETLVSDLTKLYDTPTVEVRDSSEHIVSEVVSQLADIAGGKVHHYVSSGFPGFDLSFGGGFERGTLTIVTGPSEVGKSVLLQQCLLRMTRQGTCVGYVMLDSNKLVVPKRLLCSIMGVSYDRLHSTDATLRPAPQLYEKAVSELKSLPIRLVGQQETHNDFKRIHLWARRHVRDHGMSALMIDAVSQIRTHQERGQSKEECIAELVNQMLLAAQELNIPVIAISELNRDKESSTIDRLKGSGRLTFGADVVLEVTREKDEHGYPTNKMHVSAVKNRNGQHNEALFKGDRNTFSLKEV